MKIFRVVLTLLLVSSFAGCVSTSQSVFPKLESSLSVEAGEQVRHALSISDGLQEARILALVTYHAGGKEHRFRVAITPEGLNRFRLQLLPTTSLMVLESFYLEEGKIERVEGGVSEFVSEKIVFDLIGEMISPEEFFALLLGRVPRSERFRTFREEPLRVSEDGSIGGQRSIEYSLVFEHRKSVSLKFVELNDRFREEPVLRLSYRNEESAKVEGFPALVTLSILRRDVDVRVELLQVKIP
ncbi:MAG: hypothetical protein KDD70_00685 [Bdellovibrionales bacterium]|nr:hypothetical protein [Bdellovibrionales bacterium]